MTDDRWPDPGSQEQPDRHPDREPGGFGIGGFCGDDEVTAQHGFGSTPPTGPDQTGPDQDRVERTTPLPWAPPGPARSAPVDGPPQGPLAAPGYVPDHRAGPPAPVPMSAPGPGVPAGPGQPPPPGWSGFPPPGAPLPPGARRPGPPPAPRGRVSRWVWPVVVVLALVLGAVGGTLGGVAYVQYSADQGTGAVSSGLGSGVRREVPLEAEEGSVAAVAQELLPSTVQILAEGSEGGATGSGFVLDDQGHVVTNNHVVAGAADGGEIQLVDSEGERFAAEIVGRSPVYDLAVLQADEVRDMRPAALGASNEMAIGEGVVAIGSPLGLTSTVTSGIVSAKNRPVTTGGEDESSFINAVQTDAAINPGNSGGPLVNLGGQVVGVNSAIATAGGFGGGSGNIGVGFAIPIEQVEVTADQILTDGEARFPVIGAQVQTGETDEVGALVSEVNPGSPADAAGLQDDDLVTEIDGEPVTDGVALIVAIRTYQPGQTVELTVERDGEEQQVSVELGSEVG